MEPLEQAWINYNPNTNTQPRRLLMLLFELEEMIASVTK